MDSVPICPVCLTSVEITSSGVFCPNCKITLAQDISTFLRQNPPDSIRKREAEKQEPKLSEKKRFRHSIRKFAIVLVLFFVLVIGLFYGYFYFFGDNGYREQLFSKYGFTEKAKWYLRLNTFFLVVQDTKSLPMGNPSKYDYMNKTVVSGSKHDQLAIHEITHAWYWKISGKIDSKRYEENQTFKKDFTDAFMRLTEETDKEFENAALFAGTFRVSNTFCPKCIADGPLSYQAIDSDHLFVYLAVFTLGNFKEGKTKLPSYLWPYMETMFTGNVKGTVCYDDDTCEHVRFNPVYWREVIEKFCKNVTPNFCQRYKPPTKT